MTATVTVASRFAAGKQVTVRDFTMVFDAYTQFEESVLTAKMRMAEVCGGTVFILSCLV